MDLLNTAHSSAYPFTPHHLAQVALIATAAAPGLLLLSCVPLPLVLPLLSIVSFVIACTVTLFAHYSGADNHAKGFTTWSVAAAFALIWIVAAKFSDPVHVVRFFDRLAMDP
jgi:hypothetical protein